MESNINVKFDLLCMQQCNDQNDRNCKHMMMLVDLYEKNQCGSGVNVSKYL